MSNVAHSCIEKQLIIINRVESDRKFKQDTYFVDRRVLQALVWVPLKQHYVAFL